MSFFEEAGRRVIVYSMKKLALVAHNLRSAHNVGSLLRTADGLGVTEVLLTGYTPYPKTKDDIRLPHIAQKVHNQVSKTALGAEASISWQYIPDIDRCLEYLKHEGYQLIALEQTASAQNLHHLQTAGPAALLVGNEIKGLEADLLKKVPVHVQIPMSGRKESFNVAVAAAIALYHLRYP